eukprot:403353329
MMFNLSCIECQNACPVQPVPMTCCLRMICKPCVKRKAKELLTMPLKMKQQLMQIQAQKSNGQAPKELLYECPPCGQMHPIKEMLRWPINQVVDAYIKEVILSSNNHNQNTNSSNGKYSGTANQIDSEEKQIANELGEEDSPFNKTLCERCEKTKPKVVCYDCGSLGTALCEPCSQNLHNCGSFLKHKIVPNDKKLAQAQAQQYLLEDDIKSMNNLYLCRDHANAEFERYCLTCNQLMCNKCINTHVQKHPVRTLKDAAEEVMSSYRNTLDKINDSRSKTDSNIINIKHLMTKAESDAHKTEHLIRAKIQQLKYFLEQKEKECIQNVHMQKQKVINQLVQEKIELEDFKLKEQFPIKLFEILEEKVQSKELPLLTILSQTKYFKKLLEHTYTLHKEQSKVRDVDPTQTTIPINTELIENKMLKISEFIDQQFHSINKPDQYLQQQQQNQVSITLQSSSTIDSSNNMSKTQVLDYSDQNSINNQSSIGMQNKASAAGNKVLSQSQQINSQILAGQTGVNAGKNGSVEIQIINQKDQKPISTTTNEKLSTGQNLKHHVSTNDVVTSSQVQKKTIVLGQQNTNQPQQNQNKTNRGSTSANEDSRSQSRPSYQSKVLTASSKNQGPQQIYNDDSQQLKQQQIDDKKNPKSKRDGKDTTPKSFRPTTQSQEVNKSVDQFQEKLQSMQNQAKQAQTNLLKKRVFTKTECSSTSIKLQWDHQKDSQFSFGQVTILYLLEYGIGVKVNGVEQFRQVYQGKAHRCIITDLNPRTNYRIRVCPAIAQPDNPKEVQEIGEWSEVLQVQTLDNQKINTSSLNDESVQKLNQCSQDTGDLQNMDMDNSFISQYSVTNLHQHTNRQSNQLNGNDCFIFNKPTYIHGEQEWTFGKHFFQVDSAIQENLISQTDYNFTCFLTVGLICTVATKNSSQSKSQDKTPTKVPSNQHKKKNEPIKKEEIEQVIVGCKVGVKDQAQVQVYVNLEKHLLLCIANGKIHEKFDLSSYSSCIPVIKYDGDAHLQQLKIIASAQFDLQVPYNIEQIAQEYIQEQQQLNQQQQQQLSTYQQNLSNNSQMSSNQQQQYFNNRASMNVTPGQQINGDEDQSLQLLHNLIQTPLSNIQNTKSVLANNQQIMPNITSNASQQQQYMQQQSNVKYQQNVGQQQPNLAMNTFAAALQNRKSPPASGNSMGLQNKFIDSSINSSIQQQQQQNYL